MPAHQLGLLVVGGTGQIAGHGRVAELRGRRHGKREHLDVVAERVHDPPPGIQVDERGVLADPGLVAEDPFADSAA